MAQLGGGLPPTVLACGQLAQVDEVVGAEAGQRLVAAMAVEHDRVALGRLAQHAVLRVGAGRDERLLLGAHEVAQVLLELRRRRLDAVLLHAVAERCHDGVDVRASSLRDPGEDADHVSCASVGRPPRLVLDDVEECRDGGRVEPTGQGGADAPRRVARRRTAAVRRVRNSSATAGE